MNALTYLWMRYKETSWHMFHVELWRGWNLNSTLSKFMDGGLLGLGLLIMALDQTPTGVGYFILILVVLGQNWIINCFTKDLRASHNAFLVALHMLDSERKGKKDEDSGS